MSASNEISVSRTNKRDEKGMNEYSTSNWMVQRLTMKSFILTTKQDN